jgi:hypothetical protein
MISDELSAMEAKITAELAKRPEYFVSHPAEMSVLEPMSDAELEEFAVSHGWRVVRRLGGRQIQFYNDVTEQVRNEDEAS